MRLNIREKKLAIITAVLVVSFVVFQLVLVPFVSRLRDLQATAKGLASELTRHRLSIRQKEVIEAQYGRIQSRILRQGTDEEEIYPESEDDLALPESEPRWVAPQTDAEAGPKESDEKKDG